MKRAFWACQGTHAASTQPRRFFLPHTCEHLVHLTEPILRPATISCADSLIASRGCNIGDLLGFCSAMCKVTVATRRCTVLDF